MQMCISVCHCVPFLTQLSSPQDTSQPVLENIIERIQRVKTSINMVLENYACGQNYKKSYFVSPHGHLRWKSWGGQLQSSRGQRQE